MSARLDQPFKGTNTGSGRALPTPWVRRHGGPTIQDYLGHRDVRHTELYTEVDASRFRGLWRRTGSER